MVRDDNFDGKTKRSTLIAMASCHGWTRSRRMRFGRSSRLLRRLRQTYPERNSQARCLEPIQIGRIIQLIGTRTVAGLCGLHRRGWLVSTEVADVEFAAAASGLVSNRPASLA